MRSGFCEPNSDYKETYPGDSSPKKPRPFSASAWENGLSPGSGSSFFVLSPLQAVQAPAETNRLSFNIGNP